MLSPDDKLIQALRVNQALGVNEKKDVIFPQNEPGKGITTKQREAVWESIRQASMSLFYFCQVLFWLDVFVF